MKKYRAGIIGLGTMGMLLNMEHRRIGFWKPEDAVRPTSELDIHHKAYLHEIATDKGASAFASYADALQDRPEIEFVAAAERDPTRRNAFIERYGIDNVYDDAEEMLRKEKLEIVAIPTNTRPRADLTVLAVECGAKGIMTEKPMAYTLEDADRMVKACADANVPLVCGAISTSEYSFGKAKEIIESGEIGDIVSIEASSDRHSISQHQNWSYFVDSNPAWVIGTGDTPPKDLIAYDGKTVSPGSQEFDGEGMMVTDTGQVVHFRKGAPGVRITCTDGELFHSREQLGWTMWKNIETPDGKSLSTLIPWDRGKYGGHHQGTILGMNDIVKCIKGELDEPKNSGRRIARAIEVEIALVMSAAQCGVRIDLPLKDRSLGLFYDWHR
jgi:hypothetical protein